METARETAVFIIGPENQNTSFLIFAIEKELKFSCTLYPVVEKFIEQKKEQILHSLLKRNYMVLIDSLHTSFEEVLKHLSPYMSDNHIYVALFNLAENTGIEKSGLAKNIIGYFYKDDKIEHLLKGITCLLNRELWISRKLLAQYLFQSFEDKREVIKEQHDLTQREIEILNMVSLGSSNEEISENLDLSLNTVKTHLYNIYKKIDVNNRFQAAMWASKNI